MHVLRASSVSYRPFICVLFKCTRMGFWNSNLNIYVIPKEIRPKEAICPKCNGQQVCSYNFNVLLVKSFSLFLIMYHLSWLPFYKNTDLYRVERTWQVRKERWKKKKKSFNNCRDIYLPREKFKIRTEGVIFSIFL